MPYIGVDSEDKELHLLYGLKGEPTAVIRVTNRVLQYSANPDDYMDFHSTMLNVIKILGEGHFLQKIDVLSKAVYEENIGREYLQKKYDEHFKGREYTVITTYLAITRQIKSGMYVYNKKMLADYKQNIYKILQLLQENNFKPVLLNGTEIDNLIKRTLAMDFQSKNIVLDNIVPTDTHIKIGDRTAKCLSLIDIDRIDLPETVSPYIERNDKEALKGFPVDTMAFLHTVPHFDTIIYNQVIEIPRQTYTIQKLELKKKRHSGIPDPANDMCVKDIDKLLQDVARENQLLVNAHFNIVVCAKEEALTKAVNFIENSLFTQGIIPSRNSFNQLELFRTVMAGNAVELKHYDLYLTTSDAALTFFFKEALPVSEPSPRGFYVRFTDRQGIPIQIDPADYPYDINRINNRNKFVLGPSGSGKSFFMNALVEQYMMHNMDVVIVDTGDSYSGTCSYYGGKYITYKPEKPITMNPFAIEESEYNLEKKDFLQTLVALLWKGADGKISQVEADVISDVITSYYSTYFNKKEDGWEDNAGIRELEKYLQEFGVDTHLLMDAAIEKAAKANRYHKDYYGILEVKKEATYDEIKKSYKRLVLVYHPDRNPDAEEAEGKFIEVSEAYQVLSDPKQRADYDEAIAITSLTKSVKGLTVSDDMDGTLAEFYGKELRRRIKQLNDEIKIDNLSFNSFYDYALFRIPLIIEREKIVFDIDEFRFVLKKFYKGGEFETILNEKSDNSLFYETFIVFEIDNIKEHKILFPIVTLIIMDVFIQKMRLRKDQRKALIIEEAWKAIASPMMAGYILYLYKTVRKFWGEAIVVTQELGDIIGNPVVKDSIINNSDTICLLDQTKFKDNYKEIANLLSINEVERKKIFTVNNLDNKDNRGRFKEVYIRRGPVGEVYGVEVSLYQYLTYTTEKPEKSAIEIYANHYGSYPDALEHFVDDMKVSKLPLGSFVTFVNLIKQVMTEQISDVLGEYRERFGNRAFNHFRDEFINSGLTIDQFVNNKLVAYG